MRSQPGGSPPELSCAFSLAVAAFSTEQVDQAFAAEAWELTPLDTLTLDLAVAPASKSIYGNMKRIHLEQAVVQLPATERLIFLFHDVEAYDSARIGQLLGFSEGQVNIGLHRARMRIRELVALMREATDDMPCCTCTSS